MYYERDNSVPKALCYVAVGKLVLDYAGQINPAVIERAMESRAIRTLESIRRILEDNSYSDTECFEIIDTLVMQFFEELEIKIDRHRECD